MSSKQIIVSLPRGMNSSAANVAAALHAGGFYNVHVKQHDVDELCQWITDNMDLYRVGAVQLLSVDTPMVGTVAFIPQHQVNYNGASMGIVLHTPKGRTFDFDGYEIGENFCDHWTDHVCGTMLEELGGVALLFLFGTEIDDALRNSLLDGTLIVEGLENPQEVFSDYPQFVTKLLSGEDIAKYVIEVDEDTSST